MTIEKMMLVIKMGKTDENNKMFCLFDNIEKRIMIF